MPQAVQRQASMLPVLRQGPTQLEQPGPSPVEPLLVSREDLLLRRHSGHQLFCIR